MTNDVGTISGYSPPGTDKIRSGNGAGKGGFLETLKGFTERVDRQMQEADRKAEELAVGKPFDLHEIAIATEKADLSFRLLLQIRNKLLEAYQEIMRMQF